MVHSRETRLGRPEPPPPGTLWSARPPLPHVLTLSGLALVLPLISSPLVPSLPASVSPLLRVWGCWAFPRGDRTYRAQVWAAGPPLPLRSPPLAGSCTFALSAAAWTGWTPVLGFSSRTPSYCHQRELRSDLVPEGGCCPSLPWSLPALRTLAVLSKPMTSVDTGGSRCQVTRAGPQSPGAGQSGPRARSPGGAAKGGRLPL